MKDEEGRVLSARCAVLGKGKDEDDPEGGPAFDREWVCLAGSNPGQACPVLGQIDAGSAAKRCIPGDKRGSITPAGVVRFLR